MKIEFNPLTVIVELCKREIYLTPKTIISIRQIFGKGGLILENDNETIFCLMVLSKEYNLFSLEKDPILNVYKLRYNYG